MKRQEVIKYLKSFRANLSRKQRAIYEDSGCYDNDLSIQIVDCNRIIEDLEKERKQKWEKIII